MDLYAAGEERGDRSGERRLLRHAQDDLCHLGARLSAAAPSAFADVLLGEFLGKKKH